MSELPAEVLELLVCPSCHTKLALDYEASELVCTGAGCGLAYPVRGGIPILLVDEARRPDRRLTCSPSTTRACRTADGTGRGRSVAAAARRGRCHGSVVRTLPPRARWQRALERSRSSARPDRLRPGGPVGARRAGADLPGAAGGLAAARPARLGRPAGHRGPRCWAAGIGPALLRPSRPSVVVAGCWSQRLIGVGAGRRESASNATTLLPTSTGDPLAAADRRADRHCTGSGSGRPGRPVTALPPTRWTGWRKRPRPAWTSHREPGEGWWRWSSPTRRPARLGRLDPGRTGQPPDRRGHSRRHRPRCALRRRRRAGAPADRGCTLREIRSPIRSRRSAAVVRRPGLVLVDDGRDDDQAVRRAGPADPDRGRSGHRDLPAQPHRVLRRREL